MLQLKNFFFSLCLLACAFAQGQDPSLPKNKADVFFFNGRVVNDIVLWQIHSKTLEYLKDENLHDLPLEGISYVHYPFADYEINDSSQLVRIEYDKLVLLNADTIFCFVKEINPLTYIYTVPGSTHERSIERYHVRKHILVGIEESSPPKTTSPKPDSSCIKKISAPRKDSTDKKQGYLNGVSTSIDYYAKGKADGQREFRGHGSLAGGALLGMIPFAGWIITPITLVVPPRTAPINEQFYQTNRQYRQGYEKGAWNKKVKRTLTGMLAGACVFFALVLH